MDFRGFGKNLRRRPQGVKLCFESSMWRLTNQEGTERVHVYCILLLWS